MDKEIMATVFLLRSDILGQCSRCKNYLSVPPISIHNNWPVCGRCIPIDKVENRARFYENVARFMFFPCKYDIYGCDIHLPFGKLCDHETNCNFKQMLCPAIRCSTYIHKNELLQHFKENHEQLILKQNEQIFTQSNTDTSSYLNRLFIWSDQVFIIQTYMINNDIVAFRVSCLDECTVNSLNFNLTISSKDLTNSISCNKFSLQRYSSKTPTSFSKEEEINIVVISAILGSGILSNTLTFSYKNKDRDYSNIDTMLSELECPICMNHMTPPIYMCTTGHSICNLCMTKLSKCPSCSSGLSNTRNFSLEKISDNATYNCKYKAHGCNFAGNVKDIEQHKMECHIQNEISCFVKMIVSCNWKGRYNEVYQHLITCHPVCCIDLKNKVSVDLNTIVKRIGFIKYDKNIFKLSIRWDKNQNDQIGLNIAFIENIEKESDKYKFFLNFINGDRIFTFSEICQQIPSTSVANVQTDTPLDLRIPIPLLKHFINQNILTFTLNIVKL